MNDDTFEDADLVEVFVAPDEFVAMMVKDILDAEGIDSFVRSDQIAWYDGIAKVGSGYWGKLFVRNEDGERAKELVAEFLRASDSSGEETGDGEETEDVEDEE